VAAGTRTEAPGRLNGRLNGLLDGLLDGLLERPLVARMLAGRPVAGPGIDDALRVAGELVADGQQVALEHVPGPEENGGRVLTELVGRVHAAGLAAACELTVPVGRVGPETARRLVREAGLDVVLDGPADAVAGVPGAGVVVRAEEPDAEARCREAAAGRVRLVSGHGAAADLAFVRCLNVLMSVEGHPEVAATDPRLIAIAGERAAWNGRAPDSWEHLMPYGVRTDEQRRLTAAGYTVRVAVTSGRPTSFARRLGGRS
jgi:proline dehydrogenase